jgi:hypothetical protein
MQAPAFNPPTFTAPLTSAASFYAMRSCATMAIASKADASAQAITCLLLLGLLSLKCSRTDSSAPPHDALTLLLGQYYRVLPRTHARIASPHACIVPRCLTPPFARLRLPTCAHANRFSAAFNPSSLTTFPQHP